MNIQESLISVQAEKTPVTASLHSQFVSLNFQIIGMKNKLMVLLLEIYQKEIYKEQGCEDIFHYAFKYARISRERVQKALRTLKNTEDKPILRAQIATQGLNKVAMVARLATPETEQFFAQHVESMPQPVLQAYVKQIRAGKPEVPKMSIELDEEMQIIFNQLKQEHQKQLKKELSNQAMLRIILKNAKDVSEDVPPKFASSTAPLSKRREISIKQNGKCAYPKCTKPIENFHHKIPFAFSRSHESLVGLCKIHHEFCHHGVIRHELRDPSQWRLALEPSLSRFDALKSRYI